MKQITYSKIGYNHPSQANWSYGIWKIDFIDTDKQYCMSHTVYESFGGDSRIRNNVEKAFNHKMIEVKGVYTGTGTPKITGIRSMIDFESDEMFELIKEFLTS